MPLSVSADDATRLCQKHQKKASVMTGSRQRDMGMNVLQEMLAVRLDDRQICHSVQLYVRGTCADDTQLKMRWNDLRGSLKGIFLLSPWFGSWLSSIRNLANSPARIFLVLQNIGVRVLP